VNNRLERGLTKDQWMKTWIVLVLATIAAIPQTRGAGFADSVISYAPGTGFATEFGSGAGYTNAAAALGEVARITPGQFGGPVDPFNPAFTREQLVSIGAGGTLTIRMDSLVFNDARNPFGIDFLVFGNSGFIITNGNFAGGGVTDGSLFSAGQYAVFLPESGICTDGRWFISH
jgi:hypothetical protein